MGLRDLNVGQRLNSLHRFRRALRVSKRLGVEELTT